ncbi:MAG: GNAT family N-acetyltransferase [Candidatus Odinarchaeota archaeon]
MPLKVQPLLKSSKEVEDFLRKDLPFNGLPLYDLTLAWNQCEWFTAHEKNRLVGCLIVFKGGRGMYSFFTRGNHDAVKELASSLPYSAIFAIIPQHHLELVKEYYQFLTVGEFLLMHLTEDQYQRPEIHSTERLSLANLDEMNDFFLTTNAGAWNPIQLEIGPFHGIRAESKLVSICGTIGVYQKKPGVSVIGNLVTKPNYQGLGYGTSVLCGVIDDLFKNYRHVTLMVESDNHAALRIYKRLGFTLHATQTIGVCQRRV